MRDTKDQKSKWHGASEINATSSSRTTSCNDVNTDEPVCWICLDGPSITRPLMKPCKCPRYCHNSCIARWQLQSAGSRKETHCEFCQARLPEWKDTLTPSCGSKAPAVMNVNFDGRTYSFEVKPGPDGYKQFTEAIRSAFSLPEDSELNITFTCDEPGTGGAPGVEEQEPVPDPSSLAGPLLTLQGPGAYDAAVHCASVSAARRVSSGQPVVGAGPTWHSSNRSSDSRGKSRALHSLGKRLKSALTELFTVR